MARKTTAAAKQAIARYETASEHYIQIIRLYETNPENLQSWVKEKTVQYYYGMLAGAKMMCESILHDQKCYRGFQYRSTKNPAVLCTVEEVQNKVNYNSDFVFFSMR